MHGKGKETSLLGLLEFFHLLQVENFNTANYMFWYKKVSLEIIFLLCSDVTNKSVKSATDHA